LAEADIYDLKGLKCPLPVLRAKKRLAGMRPGTLLWLETTDPLAAIDIPAFCSDEGHRLVERKITDECLRFLVERGPTEKI
jgi:tRNA 2-thiouridine synthesizing protein A